MELIRKVLKTLKKIENKEVIYMKKIIRLKIVLCVLIVSIAPWFVAAENHDNDIGKEIIKKGYYIDPYEYPNFNKIKKILGMEKKIDFAKATQEREKMVTRLSQTLSKKDLTELVSLSIKLKTSKTPEEQRENEIKMHEFMLKHYSSPFGFSNFRKNLKYAKIYAEIDFSALLKEIDDYESNVDKMQLVWIKIIKDIFRALIIVAMFIFILASLYFLRSKRNKKINPSPQSEGDV